MSTTNYHGFTFIDKEGFCYPYEKENGPVGNWMFSYYFSRNDRKISIFAEINPKYTFEDASKVIKLHKSMPVILKPGQTNELHRTITSLLEKMIAQKSRSDIGELAVS